MKTKLNSRKTIVSLFTFFFIFSIDTIGQGDEGSKAENFIQSEFDKDDAVKLLMKDIHVSHEDSLKLTKYFSNELRSLAIELVVMHVNNRSLYNTDYARSTFNTKVGSLRKEFYTHGMEIVEDDVAEAIKRGEVFRGPFDLPPPQPIPNGPCVNMDFENGNLNGWEGSHGQVTGAVQFSYSFLPVDAVLITPHHEIVTAGKDPMLCTAVLPMVNPDGGSYSVRLGDQVNGGNAAEIRQTFLVTPQNYGFSYSYAVVLQDPPADHTLEQRPYFSIRVLDANGAEIDCGTFDVISGAGITGFKNDVDAGGNVCHVYKEWSTVFIPLGSFIGQNVTVVFRSGDCSLGAHYGYAYVDARCTPMPLLVSKVNGDCSNPNAILTAPIGGSSYKWSPGGQTTQSITITTPGHYEVTIGSNAGQQCTTTLKYDYNANSKPPVADFTSTDGCLGIATTFTDQSVSNTTGPLTKWEWKLGNGALSSSQNPIYNYTTAGPQNVTLKVTNSDGCVDSITQIVQVYTIPDFTLAVVYSCTTLPTINVSLVNQVLGSMYECRINGGAWQSSLQFLNVPDGIATIEVRLNGHCPVSKTIAVANQNFVKTGTSASPNKNSYCKGDQVTLTSTDVNCSSMRWFADATSTTPIQTGCSYSYTLNSDSVTTYFEPYSDPNNYVVGRPTGYEDWPGDNQGRFETYVPVVIDGFSVLGADYSATCGTTATFTVKNGNGVVVAGPVSATVNCDRNKPETVVTGLNLVVPAGPWFSLEVSGVSLKASKGANTTVSQPGIINVLNSGAFTNWKVSSATKCPLRNSIKIKSKCPCPDTTLKFPAPLCSDKDFDLNTLKTTTTASGIWKIVQKPGGSNSATLNGTTFNAGKNGDGGDYVLAYVLTGGPFPNCPDSNARTIHVNKAEAAKIPRPQGVFCVSDPEQTLQLDPTSDAGKWSGTGITDINAGKFNPAVAGIGNHLINYKTNGVCWKQDTITITVVNQKISNILTPDTTLCRNASPFKIRLSTNTTPNGTWLSLPVGIVSNNGTITPSKGQANVPYKVYYVLKGATVLCSAIDSVTINFIAPDTAKITLNQGPFCIEKAALNLQKENISAAGKWSGTGITDVNLGTFNPKTAGTGVKIISYTTNGVCPYIDTIHIEVKAKTIANITNNDTILCENTPVFDLKLSTNSTAGGKWYKDNVLASSSVETTPPGNYYLKYLTTGISSECDNRDSVKITILPNENASIVPPLKKDVCPTDAEIILQSQVQPSTGVWWGVPVTGVNVSGKYNPATANAGSTKIYYGIAGKCGDTSYVEFIKHTIPVFNLGADKILCEGETTQIGTSITADTVLWQPTGDKTGNITVSTKGDYMLKLSNLPGCVYMDTIHVEVLPYPELNLGNDTTVCFELPNDQMVLGVDNQNYLYQWNTGESTAKITIKSEGVYNVRVNYDGSTCYTNDEIHINEYCPYSIFFPNAITPNGDGVNDYFSTPHHNLKGYHLMIFNRWGELLFETFSETNLWDGTYQGQKVQEDVYVWKVDYKVEETDKSIRKKTEIGRVTVVR